MKRLLCVLVLCSACAVPPVPPLPVGVHRHDDCGEVSYNTLRAKVTAQSSVRLGAPLAVTVTADEPMTVATVALNDGRSFTRAEPRATSAVISVVPQMAGTWQVYALVDAAGGCLSASPLSMPIKVEP